MFFDLIFSLDGKMIDFSLKELRNKKIIYCNEFASTQELENAVKEVEKLNSSFKEKAVYLMHLVNEKKEGSLGLFRQADFLGIAGSSPKAVSIAVKNKKISFLVNPVTEKKPLIDSGIARNLSLKNCIPIISFSYFNSLEREKQSLMMKNLMNFSSISNRCGLQAVTSSCASRFHELRSSRDLLVFSRLTGIKNEKQKAIQAFGSLFSKEPLARVTG